MNYDNKEFLTLLKGVLYQLFNRKLMFALFYGDTYDRKNILFSNISRDNMQIYDDSSNYAFANVELKDVKFREDLYERFPVLQKENCLIQVVDFLSAVTKAKDIANVEVTHDDESLYVINKEEEPQAPKEMGFVVQNLVADMYVNVWKTGLVQSPDPFIHVYTQEEITAEKKVIIVQDVSGTDPKIIPQHALVILEAGFNIPTLDVFRKEKKLKDQSDKIELIAGYDRNCIIVNYRYDTDLLTAYGTHPNQRWFVQDKQQR